MAKKRDAKKKKDDERREKWRQDMAKGIPTNELKKYKIDLL